MATTTRLDPIAYAGNVMERNPHITVVLDQLSDGYTTVWHITQRLDNPASPTLVTEYRRMLSTVDDGHAAWHARFWDEVLRPGARSSFFRRA